VRKAGKRGERSTGEIAAACFRHETSRELDPHLHTHCVVFNATFDPIEKRWKALHVGAMYRAQKYAENVYMHELAKGLRRLGYELTPSKRNFEIKGIPESVVARFSKRHQEIDAEAKKQIAAGARGNVADLRERIAHDKRKRKMKDSTASRLRDDWTKQLTKVEQTALDALRVVPPRHVAQADVPGIVAWADEHLFERHSVVNDYELMSTALAYGRGQDFGLAALREAIDKRGYLREDGTHKLTSRNVLRCELDIVMTARNGRHRHASLNADYTPSSALSEEQHAAVKQILGSMDLVTLFRGGAGTGKSFALKEVERGLVAAGRPVVVLAPQRQQVCDLQKDGLAAQTVAERLVTKQLPRNAVVIVDEAGQIGGRQLRELICLAQANNGRLILSGDTRQHGAVAASDALRAIEEHAGLKPAEICTIRRQNPELGASGVEKRFIRNYRAAVKAAATGQVIESFDRLDRLGCVREISENERRGALADEYLLAVARKESVLVVAQTRAEVRGVNEAIREHLRVAGKLGRGSDVTIYQAVDCTEAQKRESNFYQAGQWVFFLQRYGRYAKGELCEIASANERGLVLMKDGRRSPFSYRYAGRIAVAVSSEMEIARGDRLQLKFNGKSAEGSPLANGELVTVRGLRRDGSLVVEDDAGTRKTLAASQRLFNRGYAVTSYASQGKTVDTVLFADAANRAATNRNQWYVAISRGRKRVIVFTSDKAGLRANIEQNGDRKLALDLKLAAPAQRERLSLWTRLDLAALEQTRLHQAMMQGGARPADRQRINL
jgi:ATP-dependent exoDNAse (exonuclease V) alpha subunit